MIARSWQAERQKIEKGASKLQRSGDNVHSTGGVSLPSHVELQDDLGKRASRHSQKINRTRPQDRRNFCFCAWRVKSEDWATSPVDEIVEHDENGYGHDGGGEEGVHYEALGEPLDVVGVRAQARHFKVYGTVRLHGLQYNIVFVNLLCTHNESMKRSDY